MLFKDDTDKPPTSKEEAHARRVRPPPEKYDPDKLSHWSITMTVAWIIWGDIDAVRNEWDDYRERVCRLEIRGGPHRAAQRSHDNEVHWTENWHLPNWHPDFQKKLQEEFQKGSWHFRMETLWMEGTTLQGAFGEPTAASRDR